MENLIVRTPGAGAKNALNYVGGVAIRDADARQRAAVAVRIWPPCSVKKDSTAPTTTLYQRWVRDDVGEVYMEKVVTVNGETEIYSTVGLWADRESTTFDGESES